MRAARDGRVITFYSYKGGTGRTMALANTAWILAAGGKRVLAVDWDLEAPGLDRFFRPFLDPDVLAATPGIIDIVTEYAWAATTGPRRTGDWHLDHAHAERHAVSVTPERFGWPFPDGGSLDFLSAGRRDPSYAAAVSAFDWDNFYERLGGGLFLDALRDDMKASYDYVLIDSRTGLSDSADICTLHMPDVLVDCFILSGQSMDGAAAVARSVKEANYRGRGIPVFPVPMRVDTGEKEKADTGRGLARLVFDGLPEGMDDEELAAYWDTIGIPYRPYYAYEEMLATVGDESGLSHSLLSAYERLTALLSDGEVTALPRMPEPVRLRCRDAFTRRRPVSTTADVVIAYVAQDRMWADWTEALLKGRGCAVTPHDISSGPAPGPEIAACAVVLLSGSFLKSPYANASWVSPPESGTAAPHGMLVPVRVDDVRLPAPYLDRTPVDLHGLDESRCAALLLSALGLPEPSPGLAPVGPRFPGSLPAVWNAPRRNHTFTGRGLVLDQVRDQLGGGMSVVVPQSEALFGLGGVGKTQIALEYAHRFMADYDIVWWIPAEHTDAVVASLAELGDRLGAPGGEDMALACREAVRMLARGLPDKRWLLIYDNADDPEQLTDFLPREGGGHILVTSRNRAWTHRGPSLPVDVFRREESLEHLVRRAPGLTAEEADRIAGAVGDLPLAVEQAAAWLAETATPVGDYLRALADRTTDVLSLSPPADYPRSIAATWDISIARLREDSPAAVRLLQLCAFFAPEPVSAHLLYGKEMLRELRAYDPSLQEGLLLGRVIGEIGRFALAKVGQIGNGIEVHRLVQAVIRSRLTEEERHQARHVVHTVLAGARPDGDEPTDDPANWPRFAAIWPHVRASDAAGSDRAEVRRLLIDQVRYLWKRGALAAARQLAEDVLARWRPRFGEDDLQYLYLRAQLGNVLRSQGRYAQARALNEELLERQRAVLGPAHPHTYITMSALASDLAALSEYPAAVALAHEAHEGFARILHPSHWRTLNAANNLVLALRMAGRYGEACALGQEVLDRRTEVLGAGHPATLGSAARLGHDLREAGHCCDSVALLSRTHEAYRSVLGEEFPGTLSCAKSLADSLRGVGRLAEARRLTAAAVDRYREQYEAPTPGSLACELGMAADLFAAHEPEAALELTLETHAAYVKVAGETHPFTLAAANNLAVCQWGCGDAERAEEAFHQLLPRMTEVLGGEHPHALRARVNLAAVLAGRDRTAEAHAVEEAALPALRAALGPDHPDTLTAVANSALTLAALGRTAETRPPRDEAVGELRALLGDAAPVVRATAEGRRAFLDIQILAV